MVTCATPGFVLIQPNARACSENTVTVARGVATVTPAYPCLLKVTDFGPGTAVLRKGSIIAFAERPKGHILSVDQPSQRHGEPDRVSTTNMLDGIDLNEAPAYLRGKIKEKLNRHNRMWDGTLGVVRATEHAIVTSPGTVPIRARPYRAGPFRRAITVDQINKMLKVIQPSHSAWASPVVIVPKKNGKARFCVDY